MDITGRINLGLRPYRPETGSFESYDPAWNGSDPNGYSFAGGEPILGFDPDGRLAKQGWEDVKVGWNTGVGTLRDLNEWAKDMDSFSLGSPYFMEKMLQRTIQGAVDYENAGGGWNGTVNAYNRYNLMRSPGEAISGLHLVEGPGFGENLTGPERAVQWINTGNLALSLVTGFMRPAPVGEAPPIIQPEVSVRPLGGAYKDVPAAGGEIHHAPADSVSPLSTGEGPGFRMGVEDHRETASWGSSREAQAYRAEQRALIEQGRFEEAQQMDIKDAQSKFGDKYDEGIKQMQDYTGKIPPDKLVPKPKPKPNP